MVDFILQTNRLLVRWVSAAPRAQFLLHMDDSVELVGGGGDMLCIVIKFGHTLSFVGSCRACFPTDDRSTSHVILRGNTAHVVPRRKQSTCYPSQEQSTLLS